LNANPAGPGGISMIRCALGLGSFRPNCFNAIQLAGNFVYGINHGPDFVWPKTHKSASHPFNLIQSKGGTCRYDIVDNVFRESQSAHDNGLEHFAVRIDTGNADPSNTVPWRMENNIFEGVEGNEAAKIVNAEPFPQNPVLNFNSLNVALQNDPHYTGFDPKNDAGPVNPDNVVLASRVHFNSPLRTGAHANVPEDAIRGIFSKWIVSGDS
jgi:hypothetical protein